MLPRTWLISRDGGGGVCPFGFVCTADDGSQVLRAPRTSRSTASNFQRDNLLDGLCKIRTPPPFLILQMRCLCYATLHSLVRKCVLFTFPAVIRLLKSPQTAFISRTGGKTWKDHNQEIQNHQSCFCCHICQTAAAGGFLFL